MAQATARAAAPDRRRSTIGTPFLGLLDAVLVAMPAGIAFSGAIGVDEAEAVWLWVVRDLAPDLIDIETIGAGHDNRTALEALLPDLLARARKTLADAATSVEIGRRIKTQLGSEEAWVRLPTVLNALRCRALLDKAGSFGRAANGMADEATLALALQSMPLQDAAVTALVMQAMVGHVANPTRLVAAAIRIAGGASEGALQRAGFAPMLEAILAHAQHQIAALDQIGTFADMDLVCRAVDRFHRLQRAVAGYVELSRGGRWGTIAAALTKAASERLDPKLRDVAPDLNKALRRRDGTDRVDGDQILSALNGIYLLASVRDARDSLAVNALFDQVWTQTGQALEIHIERHLDTLRRSPADAVTAARLDAALKMAELRFSLDYAETMRRARDAALRRL
jgi:hypothetical protein